MSGTPRNRHVHAHSFPTRRSSDLNIGAHRWDRVGAITNSGMAINFGMTGVLIALLLAFDRPALSLFLGSGSDAIEVARHRSEEHTSELQSLMRSSYAVFCLKKKTTYKITDLKTSTITYVSP